MKETVLNRTEQSLLLFLETQLVDHRGDVAGIHMNKEDFDIAKQWSKEGFVSFVRKKMSRIRQTVGPESRTHEVRFSARAWDIVHRLRRERAERHCQTLNDVTKKVQL